MSALCRRHREGALDRGHYDLAKRALFADVADASVVDLTDEVVAVAVELLERWPLRSSDALSVACAAAWGCELFATADGRHGAAAGGYGLAVEELQA